MLWIVSEVVGGGCIYRVDLGCLASSKTRRRRCWLDDGSIIDEPGPDAVAGS